jgi:hypothetical protein
MYVTYICMSTYKNESALNEIDRDLELFLE